MTVDAAIRLRLLSLASVTALVNSRVFTVILPQGVTLPAICVLRVGQLEPIHLRGPINDAFRARVQVNMVAPSKASLDALDLSVHGDGLGSYASGLKGFRGTIGSPAFNVHLIEPAEVGDLYTPGELREFGVRRDYFVTFTGVQ